MVATKYRFHPDVIVGAAERVKVFASPDAKSTTGLTVTTVVGSTTAAYVDANSLGVIPDFYCDTEGPLYLKTSLRMIYLRNSPRIKKKVVYHGTATAGALVAAGCINVHAVCVNTPKATTGLVTLHDVATAAPTSSTAKAVLDATIVRRHAFTPPLYCALGLVAVIVGDVADVSIVYSAA